MAIVFLIGPRAVGKSSVGQELARSCGCPFVDTDQVLQQTAGQSVAEIVAAEGWPGFRARESAVLRAVTARCAGLAAADAAPVTAIIATGGGMVLDPDNVRHMRDSGVVVYLRAPAGVLAGRLSRNPQQAQRPSLTGQGLLDEVQTVLQQRSPLYTGAAHITVEADVPLAEVCTSILAGLGGVEQSVAPSEADRAAGGPH